MCIRIFIDVLFVTVEIWKQTKYAHGYEYREAVYLLHIHYYLQLKKNELQLHCMNMGTLQSHVDKKVSE